MEGEGGRLSWRTSHFLEAFPIGGFCHFHSVWHTNSPFVVLEIFTLILLPTHSNIIQTDWKRKKESSVPVMLALRQLVGCSGEERPPSLTSNGCWAQRWVAPDTSMPKDVPLSVSPSSVTVSLRARPTRPDVGEGKQWWLQQDLGA